MSTAHHTSLQPRSQQKFIDGFTLIEMLAVIAIISIGLSVALPWLQKTPERLRLDVYGHEIYAALIEARSGAAAQGEEKAVIVNVADHSIIGVDGKPLQIPEDLSIQVSFARTGPQKEAEGIFTFFPDGTATGGQITISGPLRSFGINVSWLTGGINVKWTDR